MFAVTSRVKFWILFFALAVTVALLAAATLWGMRFVYASREKLVQAQRELNILVKKREGVVSVLPLLTNLGDEQTTLESAFVDPNNPLPFFESIEDLGRRTGVKVVLRQTSAAGGEYAVAAAGVFHQVFSFLKRLETMPFLISSGDAEINAVSMLAAPDRKSPAEPIVELKITVSTLKP